MERFKLKMGDRVEIQVAGIETDVEWVDVELIKTGEGYLFKSLTNGSNREYYPLDGAIVRKRI